MTPTTPHPRPPPPVVDGHRSLTEDGARTGQHRVDRAEVHDADLIGFTGPICLPQGPGETDRYPYQQAAPSRPRRSRLAPGTSRQRRRVRPDNRTARWGRHHLGQPTGDPAGLQHPHRGVPEIESEQTTGAAAGVRRHQRVAQPTSQGAPRLGSPSAARSHPLGRESTRTPGPSAANTPQVLLRSAVCASRFATIDHWRRPLPPRPGWPARPCAPRRHGRRSGHPRPERPARASDPRSSRFPVWGAIRRSRRPVPTHDRIGRPPDGLIPRSGGHRPARPLRHLDTVGAESGLVTARR